MIPILTKLLNTRTLIIVLLLIIFVLFAKAINLINLKNSLTKYYAIKDQEIKTWKDNSGYWRSKAETAEINREDLKKLEELKNLSKEFEGVKKSLKNLENYIGISSETTINKTVNLKDTTIYKNNIAYTVPKFEFKDEWTDITGVIDSGKVDLKISSKDSLDVVQYWDRKWFLGKKKYFTEIKSFNPNTKITYQRSIKTKRKKGLFNPL